MAEDGCINSGIFQNLDILGKVEFKDVEFTGNSSIGTSPSSDILTIKSRINMPNADDVSASKSTRVLVRQSDNTLRFEPKAEEVFKTIAVDNQDNIEASNLTDTFTLKPGTNMTIETDTSNKSITFSSSTGSNVQNIYKTIRVDGYNDLIPDTSIDVLKFTGTSNIDIIPSTTTNTDSNEFKAEITYTNNFHTDTNNVDDAGKNIELYNYQTSVKFRMISSGTPTVTATSVEFLKGSDLNATANNLSTAINNHTAFSSIIETANNKIIVRQISSSGNPTSNSETFTGITLTNFVEIEQEISTLTIGLKDNKITDDLVIGEDSSDMLLVNSETTFVNNTTFSNDVKITDNLQVDNLNIDGNTISSTDTNGDINITPNGSGKVDIDNVDIDGGNIDGTIIGATTAAAGTFTELNVSDGNIINVDAISLVSIAADTDGQFSFGSNWTAATRTCADLGTVTTADINGGTIDNVTIGTNSVCTDLRVDNIKIDENTISSTNTDGNIEITPNGSGKVDIDNVDIDGGTIDGTTINTSDITVPSGKSIDIQNATLSLADNQISGDKIEGGTINSITILNLEGPMDTNNEVISNVNIVSGSIDGVTIGTKSVCTDLRVDNIKIDGNTISSTDTTGTGNINIMPNGSGKIDAGTADIESSGIIGNSNATLLGTISASTPLQPNIISVGTLTSLDISGDLSVDTNVLKVDTTNNKVGINKTSPTEALDIVGNVNISNKLKIGSVSGGDKRITYLNSTNEISNVLTPQNTNVVLAHTGSGLEWVGYGDVSAGGIDTNLVVDLLSSPLNTDYYVGNDENNLFVSSGKSNFLEDVNIIDSILRVDNSSGNALLFSCSSTLTTNPTIESTNGKINIVGDDPTLIIQTKWGSEAGSDTHLLFKNNATNFDGIAKISGLTTTSSGGVWYGSLAFSTWNHDQLYERMRIDHFGNVGIGTNNPSSKLHINNSSTAELIIQTNNATNASYITYKNTVKNWQIGLLDENSGSGIFFYEYTEGGGPGTHHLRIQSGGNVGIGSTSPGSKLDVNGEIRGLVGGIGQRMIPIGGIIMWNGETAPDGWALCNGQTVNGHTTPDLRGRFIMSSTYNQTITLDNDEENTNETTPIYEVQQKDGEQEVTLSDSEMPIHTHGPGTYHAYSSGAHQHEFEDYVWDPSVHGAEFEEDEDQGHKEDHERTTLSQGNHSHEITTGVSGTAGGGGSHQNNPPYYVLAYIMRVY